MKRYYLVKIETVDDPLVGPVIRHRLQIAHPGTEYLGGQMLIANGRAVHPALLVMVSGTDHSVFQGDPKMVPIPDAGLGLGVGSLSVETKLQTKAAIIELGFSVDETETLWQNTTGMRAILNFYGRKNNPDFDADKFDLYQN